MGMASACRRPTAPRVLIIDDSVVARALIARAIEAEGRFVVIGAVASVDAALALLGRLAVDAILLDVELPGVDGLTALPDLIAASAGARVLVVSSSCGEGASSTVRALAQGAADTLVKPGHGSATRFAEALVDKLERVFEPVTPPQAAPVPQRMPPRPERAPAPTTPAERADDADAFDVVAIGASTGGIHALGSVLRALTPAFTTPILVTQHLPASFIPYFAAQLADMAGRPCDVGTDRLRLRPGRIIVAPGDAHLRCVSLQQGGAGIRLGHAPAASGCLPSVDMMLASLPPVFGARVLAVVLSGMGRDGSEGARLVAEAGGCVVAQDQASSVVWGMPGAAAGVASALLPPDAIGQLIAGRGRPA